MLKFPQDFYHTRNDADDEQLQRDVARVQKQLRKYAKTGEPDYFYIAGRQLVGGVVDEEGRRSIFVAKDFYTVDYEPGEGWMKNETD